MAITLLRLIELTLMIDAVEAPCDSPLSGACLAAAHTASLRKGLGRSEDFLRISECDAGRARNGYRLNDTGFVGGAPLSAISLRAPNRSSGSEHVARAGMNYCFNNRARACRQLTDTRHACGWALSASGSKQT
jgi:hypothetical protein